MRLALLVTLACLLINLLILHSYVAYCEGILAHPALATLDSIVEIRNLYNKPIVVRVEGAVSTPYIPLEPGEVYKFKPIDKGLRPGLYWIVAYEAPGAKALSRKPLLIVKATILSQPPRPLPDSYARLTVIVEPAGYEYLATIYVDSLKVAQIKPGFYTRIYVSEGTHRICIGLKASVQKLTFNSANLTCVMLETDKPPVIHANFTTEYGFVSLRVNVTDVDSKIAIVNYTCRLDNEVISEGILYSESETIPLIKASEAFKMEDKTIKCIVFARDEYGATTSLEISQPLSKLLPSTKIAAKKPSGGGSSFQPIVAGGPPPHLKILLLILFVAASGTAVSTAAWFVLKRRKGKRRIEKEIVTPEQIRYAELTSKISALEESLEEFVGMLGEVKGEVEEIKSRLERLEKMEEEKGRRKSTSTEK